MITEAAAAIFLVVVTLAVLQNLARGTLPQWLRAKFFNQLGPAPSTSTFVRPDWMPLGPTAGARYSDPVPGGAFLSGWGAPRSGERTHKGIDLAGVKGAPVRAADDGTAVRVGDGGSLCGKRVAIRNATGIEFLYCHLSAFAVDTGDRVRRGQVVGYIGSTGNAQTSGPHLHFEIRVNGYPIDPRALIGR